MGAGSMGSTPAGVTACAGSANSGAMSISEKSTDASTFSGTSAETGTGVCISFGFMMTTS